MTRRLAWTLAIFTTLAALAGCAGPRPPAQPVGILAAGPGSAFLPYAEGVATHLRANGANAKAIESTGSIENLRRIDATPTLVGTAFLGSVHEAVTGTGSWTQGKQHANVRALFPMYETSFQVVALRTAGLTSVAQLAGKRVGVGPAGGPAEGYFQALLQELRLQATLVHGTPSALAADLLAGRIDALWQGAALPVPAIQQVANAADAIVFGLAATEQAAMLRRFPFLSAATIPAATYRGQAAPLQSVAAWNFVVAHRDLPDADAYWITRTVLDAQDPRTIHPSAAPTRTANAVHNRVVPFHPGALRYYREKGLALP